MTQFLNHFMLPAKNPNMGMAGMFTLGATPYLLDDVTGATAGYAVHKLSMAYAGNCLKVRRSSDDATLDIGFNGYYLDFAALESFIGSSSAFIDTWYDQSGNTRNLVQATTGLQPQIINSGSYYFTIGNYPNIDFGGTQYIQSSVAQSNFITASAGTIVSLWNADTATTTGDGNVIWGNLGGWNGCMIKEISGTPNIRAYGYDGTEDFVTIGSKATGVSYITAWQHGSATLYNYIDSDTAAGSTAHGDETTLSSQWAIGRDIATAAGTDIFDGRVAMLLIYNTALSVANINTLGGAIASAYSGTTWT